MCLIAQVELDLPAVSGDGVTMKRACDCEGKSCRGSAHDTSLLLSSHASKGWIRSSFKSPLIAPAATPANAICTVLQLTHNPISVPRDLTHVADCYR